VNVERSGPVVRVGVADGSNTAPRLRDYGPDAVTGRGMVLVDRIARRWGVDVDKSGKCVWFEIDARAEGELRAQA
jgi:hypothetical protein